MSRPPRYRWAILAVCVLGLALGLAAFTRETGGRAAV